MTPAVRPLAMGDMIRDNDPRMTARPVLVVTGFFWTKSTRRAYACKPDGERRSYRDERLSYRIAVSRIHLDGKPRRSGWSRVTT